MRYVFAMIGVFVVTLACSHAMACIDGNSPEDLAKRQREAFDQSDARHDGRITFDEWFNAAGGKRDVENMYNKTHQQKLFPCKANSRACEDQARLVFNKMDKNGDGILTFEEWAISHPQSSGMFATDCM